jgi:hypothetical protein
MDINRIPLWIIWGIVFASAAYAGYSTWLWEPWELPENTTFVMLRLWGAPGALLIIASVITLMRWKD